MNGLQKLSGTVSNVRLHWKTPAFGYFVPYKETAAYSVGGMGIQFALSLTLMITFNAGNMLMGNVIGISPTKLALLNILATILNFAITAARAYIIDNTRSKYGKFRPYLLYMGIPTVALSVIFVFLPFGSMQMWTKMAACFVFYTLIQLVSPFYQYSYTNLVAVISPNTQERTNIITASTIILSLAPSITGFIVPFFSDMTGGMTDIRTYRFFYPVFSIVGLIIGYFAFFGTKERIVQAKTHVIQIGFFDAIRAVSKNKYFWIISLASWIGFMESATGVIFSWEFIYGHADQMKLYAILATLVGNSALWSMLLSPWAIKRFGKRNLLIWSNLMNIIFLAILYPVVGNVWLMFLFIFCNGFISGFAQIYNPAIDADMRDYQQYLTGERIDGMFSTVRLIGTLIGLLTGLVIPAIYERMGVHDDYSVLSDLALRTNLFHVLIIAAVIGAVINVIPYFFYDLTEQKHSDIIHVLRVRSLFEDYGNGVLSDENLADTIDMIHEANRLNAMQPVTVTKDAIKQAKALPGADRAAKKEAVRAAKKAYRDAISLNKRIGTAHIVTDEMNKFTQPEMQEKLRDAHRLYDAGLRGFLPAGAALAVGARSLPVSTAAEKSFRNYRIRLGKDCLRCEKSLKKFYPNGLVEPDIRELEAAYDLPDETKEEKMARKKEIHRLTRERSRFQRAAKVFVDARRLVRDEENYSHYDEILAGYDQAKANADENRRRAREESEALEAKRLEEMNRLKQERLERLDPEKRQKLLDKQQKKQEKEEAKRK